MSLPTWALWLAALGVLLVRALLAAGESALFGTADLAAKELAKVHPRRGARLVRLKAEREATTASLRFALVLLGFSAAGVGAVAPPRLLDSALAISSPWVPFVTSGGGVLLVAVLAILLDVTARSLASSHPEAWALRISGLLSLTVALLHPVMRIMLWALNLVVRPFGTSVRFESPPPPLEELEKLLAAKAARNEVDKDAPQLIRSVFELSEKSCRDVMVARTEVVAIEMSAKPEDILRILAEENHSRIPAYKDDIDHIVGILHSRDLIPMLQHPQLIVLQDLVRPVHFVPWVKPIGDLLREMQRMKIHMACVVDEYGGFMGIVTLEDILREIVGDIGDEFDVEVKQVEKQPDGSYLVDAMMAAGDFSTAFGFPLPEGDFETLAGFLASLAGAIPEVGDKFVINGWQFIVHAKAGPRLDRIRLVKPRISGSFKELPKAAEEPSPKGGTPLATPEPETH